MPSFLELPRELRDEIIGLVVTSQISHPANGTRRRPRIYSSYSEDRLMFLPSSAESYRPPSLSLLYTSKQVRAETLSIIAREKVDALVGLTVVDGVWTWPTYRNILPFTSTSLKLLVLDVVLAISCESAQRYSAFAAYSAIFSFISRFLRHGPVGDSEDAYSHLDLHVREVRIDFDTKRHRTGNYLFTEDEVPMREVDGLAHLTDQHKWLYGVDAATASEWINTLTNYLGSGSQGIQFWWVIQGGVERIVFNVDGQMRGEWVLGRP